MKPSEITFLRKELVKVVAENKNLQKKIFEIKTTLIKRNALLELEDDRLRLEIAARDRRMETCENSDTPSSTDSLYNSERTAFRKKMEEEDMREDGPEPNGEDTARKGPPAGYADVSHGNKAERTVVLRVHKCEACGHRHLSGLPPRVKMVYDFGKCSRGLRKLLNSDTNLVCFGNIPCFSRHDVNTYRAFIASFFSLKPYSSWSDNWSSSCADSRNSSVMESSTLSVLATLSRIFSAIPSICTSTSRSSPIHTKTRNW